MVKKIVDVIKEKIFGINGYLIKVRVGVKNHVNNMKKTRTIIIIMSFIGLIITLIWGSTLPDLNDNIPLNNIKNDTIIQDTIIPIEDKMEIEVDMNCGDTIIVKATMYQATQNQCDDTPDLTADQTKIPNVDSCSHLNWIAVSQDLLWFNDGPIRYGDTVYVIAGHKTGYYVVHDAMNKRWTNRIDFLESIGVEAYKYNKAELIINI
jgi:3D (Asp-Asp-Asp) domain-containing protein